MGLRNPFMIKVVDGATDLSLEAKAGTSLLVKRILIANPANNYLKIKVDNTMVGYWRVGGNLGSHLDLPKGSSEHSHSATLAAADGSLSEDHAITDGRGQAQATVGLTSSVSAATTFDDIWGMSAIPIINGETILDEMIKRGLFAGYPIAEGQTMVFDDVAQSGSIQIAIYEEYDAADIKASMPNGSASKEFIFMNYGRPAANITTSTDTLVNTPVNPSEFPDFPYGKDVPAKYSVSLHGVFASDLVFDLGSDDCMNTSYLKLIRERVTLFDEDRNGFLLKGIIGNTDSAIVVGKGYSMVGNQSSVDHKKGVWFPQPVVFGGGEELGVYLTTVAGASQSSSDLLVANCEVGLLMSVKMP